METQKVDGNESDRHDHADDTSKDKENPDITKELWKEWKKLNKNGSLNHCFTRDCGFYS